jgi:hypothetical protein
MKRKEAGACTDNGSMAVGSGAQAGGITVGSRAEEEEGHEFLGIVARIDTFRGRTNLNFQRHTHH